MAGNREFYIVDLRKEWATRPCVTVWRPNNCGYAYPLSWAGRYDEATVVEGGPYYSRQEGRRWERFAVPCDVVDKLAIATPPRIVDGDAGPVVMNTGVNRTILRCARFRPPPEALIRQTYPANPKPAEAAHG